MAENYITTFECIQLPDGRVLFRKDLVVSPDNETEIIKTNSNLPLRDVTDEELNEIMEEIEREKTIKDDIYPLKGIRRSMLKA